MKCPKCGNEMMIGEIGASSLSVGHPAMFWAPDEVFKKYPAQFLTQRKAIAEGGIEIKIGNGLTNNRTRGYACRNCNFVLLDLN